MEVRTGAGADSRQLLRAQGRSTSTFVEKPETPARLGRTEDNELVTRCSGKTNKIGRAHV